MPRIETYVRLLLCGTVLAAGGFLVYRKYERKQVPLLIGLVVGKAEGSTAAAAARLAAQEVSNEGGFRGRSMDVLVGESAGDPRAAAAAAEQLIRNRQVIALLVDGSPAECDAVAEVAGRARITVFTAQPSLGLDDAGEAIKLGGLPNQRIAPAIAWALEAVGDRVILVASDGPLQRVANAMLMEQIRSQAGTVLEQIWIGRDGVTPESAAAQISALVTASRSDQSPPADRPRLIVSGIEAADAVKFAVALRKDGVSSEALPTLHYALGDHDIASLHAGLSAGDYIVDATSDAAYAATRLTALAARRRDAIDRSGIRAAVLGSRVSSPSGPVAIDPLTAAAWFRCRVGRLNDANQVVEVWSDEHATRPRAWPIWKSREEWRAIADGTTTVADPMKDEDRPYE
ncbi:MAG: transporter substrate-binding protein [Phycisphaerae bacterium]|nr:transporter substrate-binding protein [Phycisphaerae bacterium]